jgi:SMC interacting uncharacterized protein involved in chromosome segregation
MKNFKIKQPEVSIEIETEDGKKLTVSPQQFHNYVENIREQGQKWATKCSDLENETRELTKEIRLLKAELDNLKNSATMGSL